MRRCHFANYLAELFARYLAYWCHFMSDRSQGFGRRADRGAQITVSIQRTLDPRALIELSHVSRHHQRPLSKKSLL